LVNIEAIYIPDKAYDILISSHGKAYLDYRKIKPERENPNPKLYVCMPLVQNIPINNHSDWTKTTCPECGKECWKRPLPKELQGLRQAGKEIIEVCTHCAIRHGTRGI
jgi:hypothetical protein